MEQTTLVENRLIPLRKALTEHRLYEHLQEVADIRTFMESHVYAVWDFMSLLKALQQLLTTTTTPWVPSADPQLARFINEIVLEEESDLNEEGLPQSHFEMYLSAMEQIGASTNAISKFIAQIKAGNNIKSAARSIGLDPAIQAFVEFTFVTIGSGEAHKIASAFTFGREDVIPDMFLGIIRDEEQKAGREQYTKLTYYLKRHIELDGDEHGPLALRMISQLCGDDQQKWEEVMQTAEAALAHRIGLWDYIADMISEKSLAAV
jgi:hypothetical protein